MKYISIIGSTGSIGTQTLEIVRANPDIEVSALACGKNIDLMEKQIREFKPACASVWSEKDAADLRTRLKDMNIQIHSGMEGLIEVATYGQAELVITAIVGMRGLKPTVEAIKAGKHIGLANKETLVTAGHLIMPMAKEYGINIYPVDSEHSAIFQSLNGENGNEYEKILLTCSGGPFRGKKRSDLVNVKAEDALKHPNWSMGRKITIDSATLVNKGLEVMEAKWLFDAELSQIEVVVHPQSIIHSAVQYKDGAIMAQLGTPDMKIPIQYAIYYPKRRPLESKRLDLFDIGTLTFERPDTETFEGLAFAYEAMKKGGNMPTIYNAANEKAVARFLNGEINFLDIPATIKDCMDNCKFIPDATLIDVLETETAVYEYIESRTKN
ncbi:MAG: 1-deoxy-D-xylulose-5-phosphate reductoisomerase [Eubacterium sp.]|nr:1-deoxy-D-xylulose-5-phosphate reductoisomerase [Eubacterium sp.]